jgi:transcriptional regulator with XRE-family HTH domain
MKRNPLLEQLRRETTEEVKREVDLSFEIADRIFEILTKKNLSQRDFAKLLGKSEAEISKWMRGTHNFTTKTIAKIEVILGESVIEVTGKPAKTEIVFIHIPMNESFKFNGKHCDNRDNIPVKSNFSTSFPTYARLNLAESLN